MGFMSITRTLFGILALIFSAMVASAPPDDRVALQGIKEGKGIFMISLDKPEKLAIYLTIINSTHDSFKRQGVRPDLKIVFIGATVKHLTTVLPENATDRDTAIYKDIARQIDLLDAKGIRIEICAIATELYDIDNATLLKPIAVINDGFISAIAYQSKGYRLVSIF